MKLIEPHIAALSTARDWFLGRYGLTELDITAALNEIFQHRVDYADLYFQYARSESWSLEEGQVKSGSFDIEEGVGVRAVTGEKQAFSYSDDISREALMTAARATRGIARTGVRKGAAAQPTSTTKKRSRGALYAPMDPLATMEPAEKVALLERLEKLARARDPRITHVMANLAGTYEVVMVAASSRFASDVLAADIRPLVRLSLTVIAEQDGRREQGFAGGGGRFGYAFFDQSKLELYANEAVDQALVNLDARPAPAGSMTVVLGPGWPGVLLHEAIGHGLEGDFNRKGSSAFSGRIGERVAAKGVTIVDDGTLPDRRGSLNIDDEGNSTQCTTLIEDGILVGYMQDTLNARLMKTAVTGNGRRESYASLPMPRMTNTYMLNGTRDPKEIIASVQDGLYAVNFGGGQVDITNGKFVFTATEAWRIENGKVTHPVKGATLIGNGPDALTRVSMIGNDMALDGGVGTCGKEGQSIPVGLGQPTLRIDGLTVGGTA
ncbi:MAG: metalloprotease TldD [Burkholderiaceae bacterium]